MDFEGILQEKHKDNRSMTIDVRKNSGEVETLFATEVLWDTVEIGDSLKKRSGEFICSVKSHGRWLDLSFMSQNEEDSSYCAGRQDYRNCE